jgi:sphingomyelin phosphodiesterase acid-like 3
MQLLFALLLLGRWLLASDLHVEPGRSAPVPAPYGKDTNWTLFDSAVGQMRRVDPNPQVIVLPGDFLAHGFPNDVPLAQREMSRIVKTLNRAFPHAEFIIAPGNNDDPCGDYRATPGDPYFKNIAHLWAPLVNRNGAAPDFERDFGEYGWYTARLPGMSLRFVAIDSVYWSILYRRCTNAHPNAPQQELRWLARTLSTLAAGERAILVMHIPPGVDPHTTVLAHRLLVVPFLQPRVSTALVQLFGTNRARIAFALAGHTHRDDFRLFGGVPMLIAPAISPVYDNNPAFAQLDVTRNGTLRNYTLYEYDEAVGTWQDGGSFDKVYATNALDETALASVHARLQDDYALRRRWAVMLVAGSPEVEVTANTWRTYWCAQTELGSAFVSCARLKRRLEILPFAGVAAVIIVLALLAWLWYSVSRRWKRPNKDA